MNWLGGKKRDSMLDPAVLEERKREREREREREEKERNYKSAFCV